jgi:hypothetical protein
MFMSMYKKVVTFILSILAILSVSFFVAFMRLAIKSNNLYQRSQEI